MTNCTTIASPGGPHRPGAYPCAADGPMEALSDAELIALLERERVRDPDALPQERCAPEPVERIAGVLAAYTPITEQRAARNRRRLATTLHDAHPLTRWSAPTIPAKTTPITRTPLQSDGPVAIGPGLELTITTGQERS